jgi:hypothetical protein
VNTHFPKDLKMIGNSSARGSHRRTERRANESQAQDLSSGEEILSIGQLVPEIYGEEKRNSNRQTTSLKLSSGLNGLILLTAPDPHRQKFTYYYTQKA